MTKKGAPESVDSDNLGVGRNRYPVCAIELVVRLWRRAGSAWPPVALVGLGAIGGIAGCSGAAGGAAPVHNGGAATPTQDGGSVTGAQDAGGGMREGGAASEAGPSLTAGVAPGGNFDLSLWELQLPIGSPGAPTIIPPSQLVGAGGFHDAYFYTDTTDGSMTFWDPQNGVTTMGSMYPRSELRETTAAGAEASWSPTGTNTLGATLASSEIPDHVCVGQIFATTKPLLQLFYYGTGAVSLAVEQTPAGGDELFNMVGTMPLRTKWSYVIGLSGSTISLVLNGGPTQTFAMPSSFDGETMYFKAGNYDQSVGTSSTIGALVHFYQLSIHHGM
jgi:hypothetical protein